MRLPTLTVTPLAAALLAMFASNAQAATPGTPAATTSTATGPSAAAEQREPTDLDRIQVEAERIRKASSPKYTEALVDTPQTITVVTREVMDQQALIGLRDVLSTLPGITFGAGEGGGGYGDSINLRGFTAASDITTDGVRDSAQYTRSDSFNLDAIELVNGANSAMSGAGSVGGSINLVSKVAREGDFQGFTIGAGSDGFGRVTTDDNFDLGNGTAIRLNAMAHRNDVPGRDYEEYQRWGVAPSVAFGLGSDTRFTLSYLHQHDDNTPQYGVPYFKNAQNDGPLPGVETSNYYGYHNIDRQKIDVDTLTGLFEHDFSEDLTLRSLARFQKVDQLSVVDATQGTWCLDSGINVATGVPCTPAGGYQPSGPRGYSRDTSNAIAISQTDLTSRFQTGAVTHALVAGVSFSRESFDLDTGSLFRNADGSTVPLPPMDLHAPDSRWTGPTHYFLTGRTEGELNNQAAYLFDTMKFGERWLLNLGARYEHNEGSSATWQVKTYTAPSPTAPAPDNSNIGAILGRNPVALNEDDLFSYRAGLVFKPTANSSVYLSYANSKTPSKASVNGSCTLALPTAPGTGNCTADPETAINIELGTKWDVIEGRLALTGAVFRNTRENYRVNDPDPLNPSGEQALDGRARVQGAVLGVAGNITREWAVFANYTYLDSEVLQGVSDYCRTNPGTACGNSAAFPDPLRGNPLTNTPAHSASLWTTYRLGDWTLGYGATYQGEFHLNNNSLPAAGSTTPATLYTTDNYWVHRAMVAWQVNDRLALQLNVNNLLDEEYYMRIRNNGWATPGDARSAVLTASYRF